MSWVRIWVHLVFATKHRKPFLQTQALRFKVFQHIRENAEGKGIWLDCVNGYQEHAHCLISLGREQNISKAAQLIKGESSNWINKNNLIKDHFNRQDDFWAVGVSESHLARVRRYIHHQEEHHRAKTFSGEIDDFMKKYGWEIINEK